MFSLMANCFGWLKGKNKPRAIKLVIIGLDDAGKTTTIACLQGEPPDGITPTIGFSNASLTMNKWEITIYDLGGGSSVRSVWEKYYAEIYGIVFTVDSSNGDRLKESKEVLEGIFENTKVKGKPVVVLANKQDKENAFTEKEIGEQLELKQLSEKYNFQFNIFPCSALKGFGKNIDKSIKTGLNWLLQQIGKDYDTIHSKVEKESAVQREIEAQERKERMERIKKLREERERAAKEAGVNKEEEESEDDDLVTGNPFRNINDQIGVTEKREKKAKERQKKIKAYQEQQNQYNAESKEDEPQSPKKRRRKKKKKIHQEDDVDMNVPEIVVQSPTPRHDGAQSPTLGDDGGVDEVVTKTKKKKRKKKVVREDDWCDDVKNDISIHTDEDEEVATKMNRASIYDDIDYAPTYSGARIIQVDSSDNVRDNFRTSTRNTKKKKKKKSTTSLDSKSDNNDVNDDDRTSRNRTSRKLPDLDAGKGKTQNSRRYDRYESARPTVSEQDIRDSRAELFRANSCDSFQGSDQNNFEVKTKKSKTKKKKRKKIIVVEVDDEEEYIERTIRKKRSKFKNKTAPMASNVRVDRETNEHNRSAQVSTHQDNNQVSKLQPIRLRGRLPDMNKKDIPSWARHYPSEELF